MESVIDNNIEALAAELKSSRPDKEKALELADKIDRGSTENGEVRYKAARLVLSKTFGIADDSLFKELRPTAKTAASVILYLRDCGLDYGDVKNIVERFPSITDHGIENLEEKREYFGFTKEEFADIVRKFPSITGLGIENLEERREYFGFTKEEFADIVRKFPSITGPGIENLEEKREYFGFTKEEFADIVRKFPSITGFGIENLEKKRKYLMLDKERFKRLVYSFPTIVGHGEENLERKMNWYKRHFNISKEELVSRLIAKPALYANLFSGSFYGRILLRSKAMALHGKTLDDIRDLASAIKPNEKKFVANYGISVEEYELLKHVARITDEVNPLKEKRKEKIKV